MDKNHIFMSGEFKVSMKLVFSTLNWSHTMSANRLVLTKGGFRRSNVSEVLKGVIYYHRTEDYDIELDNLNFLISNNFPCWPDPKQLLSMSDRHKVLKDCVDSGSVNHPVFQGTYGDYIRNNEHYDLRISDKTTYPDLRRPKIPFPFVLKTGQEHRGEGKFLIEKEEDVPKWEEIASIEPFFIGQSCRVLFIGEKYFVIKYDNPNSWIKNSAGADVEIWEDYPKELSEHAKLVRDQFDLEITGIDYVVGTDGIHFLEINQFPGLDISDESVEVARHLFKQKMDLVEKMPSMKP